MGCNSSSDGNRNPTEDIDNYLTKEEVELVKKSWKAIEPDLDETGLIMFKRFFEQQQEMKKLFKKLLTTTETGHFVFDDARLRGHARIVMNSLGAAVDSLDDSASLSHILVNLGEKHAAYNVKGEMISAETGKPYNQFANNGGRRDYSLSKILVNLGKKHASYNVTGEIIAFLWPAIRDAMKTKLGDQFTPETELAWRNVFEYIKSNMATGISHGEIELRDAKIGK